MLKKIFKLFSPSSPSQEDVGPHKILPPKHNLSASAISRGAREVVSTLTDNGFQAFVVGGCVRDALLDLKPKDFDVATNATPEEVNKLFRRSRIIGRRFRIVHVHKGREVIEVTTFRAGHQQGSKGEARQSDKGMLLRDNVFGDISEDALRRDFTVNAFYYDPQENCIYDYANGLNDIAQRRLRVIGDPQTRYREDPVRMLRAARFSAKLAFTLSDEAAAPLQSLAPLLAEVAPARLFDEVLKLFVSGYALATFHQLQQHHLMAQLFPNAIACLEEDDSDFYQQFFEQALTNTDKRIRNNQRVTPAFLLAAFLWPEVEQVKRNYENNGDHATLALQKASGYVITRQVKRIAIPRRFTQAMREIWELQLRLPKRSGTRAAHLVSLPRFRAAYDFVLLREQAGENLDNLGHWWTKYQEADEQGRHSMVEALDSKENRPRKRRRKPRKKTSAATDNHE